MPAGLITDWTIEEVQSWLGSVALGSLKSAFKDRGINGTRMLSMGQEEREELGFTPRKSALFEKKLDEQKFKIMLREREMKKKIIAAATKPPPKPKSKQLPSNSAYAPYSPPGSEQGNEYTDSREPRGGKRLGKGLPSISRDSAGWNSSVLTSQPRVVPRDNEPWRTKEELRTRRALQIQEEEALYERLSGKQFRQHGDERSSRTSKSSHALSSRMEGTSNSDPSLHRSRLDQYENDFQQDSHRSQDYDSDFSERECSQINDSPNTSHFFVFAGRIGETAIAHGIVLKSMEPQENSRASTSHGSREQNSRASTGNATRENDSKPSASQAPRDYSANAEHAFSSSRAKPSENIRGLQNLSATELAQKNLNSLLRESTANGISKPCIFMIFYH
jgi:hypothetical protein